MYVMWWYEQNCDVPGEHRTAQESPGGPLRIHLSWQARPQHKDAGLQPLCNRLRVFKGVPLRIHPSWQAQVQNSQFYQANGIVMGRCKSENTKFAYLTTFLEMGYQMAQVQNISFTKQTGQCRANLHTLQRFWKWDTKWHRLKTITFTKQTEQFSEKSTPLSNGIGGTDNNWSSKPSSIQAPNVITLK